MDELLEYLFVTGQLDDTEEETTEEDNSDEQE